MPSLRIVIWGLAVAITLAAIALDREWRDAEKPHGPPVLLVLVLLGLLALLLPEVRDALKRVGGLKVGGIEVTLIALTDAAAGAVAALPVNPEEEDPDEKKWRLRIISSADARLAEVSVEKLSKRLVERLDWIWKNLPDLGDRPTKDVDAVARLARHGLIPGTEAQILRTVATIEFDTIAEIRKTNRRVLERFLGQADAVVHTSRLIAFDSHVRSMLSDEGFVLVDWRPQPDPQRWRDFLAHGLGPMAAEAPDSSFWISVRMAEKPDSELFRNTVSRLANPDWRAEVPGGPDATPLIVIPNGSKTLLTTEGVVEAVKLQDLRKRIRAV